MSGGADVTYWAIIAGIPILAAALCAGILIVLMPWLKSHALAQPVARSSHREPTPQGGGLGVIISTFCVVWLAATTTMALPQNTLAQLSALTGAVALLALIGLFDDVRGLPPVPRLLVQCLAVGLILVMLPSDARLFSALPLWLERACVLLVGVWFVNLVNFMDGVDWMVVTETVPITGTIVVLGLAGVVPPLATVVALALFGAILGFAPFNRPVARLFLGDVGSLPVGLVLGWLVLLLGVYGYHAAALLLPLYYLADTTITLFLRLARREPFWEAHRGHFYQRAVAGGLTVPQVVTRVFATNVALAGLAMVSVAAGSTTVSLLCLACGAGLVGFLLAHFAKARLAKARP
jgi:UDP-N-acetylmuramyl pentapeptide phosphotransferase/UDP-N-acetylglucosamine-1-phosphate transferase